MEVITVIGTVLAGFGVFSVLAVLFGSDSRPSYGDDWRRAL
jgi:hypothetical protein